MRGSMAPSYPSRRRGGEALLGLSLCLALSGPAVAQQPAGSAAGPAAPFAVPARIPPAPIAPDASTFTLANGLQVVVLPDRRLPVVTHMVWYRVGSADEPRGVGGIAHFLEHLMFKGTARYPSNAFSRRLGTLGGQENAFTSWDYTAYFQRTPKEFLRELMEFESDRMTNLQLTDEVVLPERNVILEERRQVVDSSAAAQFSEQLNAALFQHHPYRLPIIGWEGEMRGLTRADAISFYRQHYTPNNAVLIVAGDVSEAELRPIAEATYGRVPVVTPDVRRDRVTEPVFRAARRVVMADPRVQQPSFARYYATPSYGSTQEAVTPLALDVLAEILGGQTGRVFRTLVVERGLATTASASYSGAAVDFGRFGFTATPRSQASFAEVEQAIDAIIADVLERGVTAAEVDRAVNSLIASAVYAQDSAATLARVFGFGLTTGSSFEDLRNWPTRISRITVDEVNAAARLSLDIRRSATGTLARAEPPRRS